MSLDDCCDLVSGWWVLAFSGTLRSVIASLVQHITALLTQQVLLAMLHHTSHMHCLYRELRDLQSLQSTNGGGAAPSCINSSKDLVELE